MLAKVMNSNEPINITSTVVVGYDASKYNAFKHGILSKYTVMHWENREDYESLMNSLINDYSPCGITEKHLVEELAGIMWRKMRLKYAEMTNLQSSLSLHLKSNSYDNANDSAKDALLAKSHEVEGFDITEAVLATDDETHLELRLTKKNLNCFLNAKKILSDSADGYEQGLLALPMNDREDWQNGKVGRYAGFHFQYDTTVESLLSWVIIAIKRYEKYIFELENRGKIKTQILGKSFLSDADLIKYSRYENHLDKKFEKTLAILLRLKDLRESQTTLNVNS